jgi:hypothetical protein
MKEHVFRFIGAVFLTILALLGIGAVLHILVTLPLEGKGPEWIGAAGTVATLFWAVWLATGESRKRRRDELLLARLHGASMVLRLVHAEAMVSAVCQTLDVANRTPIQLTADHLIHMAKKLDDIGLWEMSDLVPLLPLPDNTAVKLAQVADQISSAKKLFAQTIADYPQMSDNERANFVEHFYTPMSGTHRFLTESVNVCHKGAQALHLTQAE